MCKIKGTAPCADCPYRKDAPLKHWSINEFVDLLDSEKDEMGKIYGCHKKNGTICKGWLMMQKQNNFPSIVLRLQLMKQQITAEELDKLHCPSPMYETVREMSEANFPVLSKHF